MFKLLIVDYNVGFRQVLSELVSRHFPAALVEEAYDGEHVLARVEVTRPNMIIMDIDLPGDNGLEVTRKIKDRYDRTVIVILSSYDFPEYRHEAFRSGADCFIAKSGIYCMGDILSRIEGTMARTTMDGVDATI